MDLDLRQNFDIALTVQMLEVEMLKEPQVSCPVYHHFGPGLYMREVNLPAGSLVLGHKQRFTHQNIFLKGKMSFLNDDGSETEISAPMIFAAPPGRKCVRVLEDVTWLNVYPTNERDIETLENTYLEKTDHWLDVEKRPVADPADIEDFKSVLKEYGFTEEEVKKVSESEDDQIYWPDGTYSVGVYNSAIHGRGLFATADIKNGDIICPARIEKSRTPAGRYTNHSKNPNAKPVLSGDNIHFVAIKDIQGCAGGYFLEEITIDYREALKIREVKPCQE